MIGIVLLSYGALQSIDDLQPFYTHIFHGKLPSDVILQEAERKFRHYQVADPLAAVTARQAYSLEKRLQRKAVHQPIAHQPIKVYTAMKHTPPFISETISQMISDGVTKIIALPGSPLFSRTGTLFYEQQIKKSIQTSCQEIPLMLISRWHLHAGLIQALAWRLQTALNWLSHANSAAAAVIFTAHSQPGLPHANQEYVTAFHELAAAIAAKLGLTNWKTAYRSATPGQKWLEPDVKHVINSAMLEGSTAVVICDLLSMTENIEALFDCRVESGKYAAELGLEFAAAEFLNDSDDYMDVLEDIVAQHLKP